MQNLKVQLKQKKFRSDNRCKQYQQLYCMDSGSGYDLICKREKHCRNFHSNLL